MLFARTPADVVADAVQTPSKTLLVLRDPLRVCEFDASAVLLESLINTATNPNAIASHRNTAPKYLIMLLTIDLIIARWVGRCACG